MEKTRPIFSSRIFSKKKALGALDPLVHANQLCTQMEGTVMLKDSVQSMEITDYICKDFLGIHLIPIMGISINCRLARSLR